MTQADLAEPFMTKGMLSHVEKGKANLSIKNLKLIAQKLNKPLSYFIEESEIISLNNPDPSGNMPYFLIYKELKDIDKMIRLNVNNSARDRVYKLLSRYDYSNDITTKSDVLLRLARVQINLGLTEEAIELYFDAIDMYNSVIHFDKSITTLLELAEVQYNNGLYNESLTCLKNVSEYYIKTANIDLLVNLKILCLKLKIYTLQCNFELILDTNKELLILSQACDIYQDMTLAFSIDAIKNLYMVDESSFITANDKLHSYGVISGDLTALTLSKLLKSKLLNNLGKVENSKDILYSVEFDLLEDKLSPIIKSLYYFEHSRLFIYSGNYDMAKEFIFNSERNLDDYDNTLSYMISKFIRIYGNIADIMSNNMITNKSEALSILYEEIEELSHVYQASTSILLSICRIEISNIFRFISFIMESIQDFKGAYSALTKANLYEKIN